MITPPCAAFVAKYSEPTSEVTTSVQNRLGATFQGKTSVWNNEVSTISIDEYAGSLDATLILFRHTTLAALADSRKPKPRADDL